MTDKIKNWIEKTIEEMHDCTTCIWYAKEQYDSKSRTCYPPDICRNYNQRIGDREKLERKETEKIEGKGW